MGLGDLMRWERIGLISRARMEVNKNRMNRYGTMDFSFFNVFFRFTKI